MMNDRGWWSFLLRSSPCIMHTVWMMNVRGWWSLILRSSPYIIHTVGMMNVRGWWSLLLRSSPCIMHTVGMMNVRGWWSFILRSSPYIMHTVGMMNDRGWWSWGSLGVPSPLCITYSGSEWKEAGSHNIHISLLSGHSWSIKLIVLDHLLWLWSHREQSFMFTILHDRLFTSFQLLHMVWSQYYDCIPRNLGNMVALWWILMIFLLGNREGFYRYYQWTSVIVIVVYS